jgi:signal peptidase II
MNKFSPSRLVPFSLSLFVIVLDQITKSIIVKVFPAGSNTYKDIFDNGMLLLLHVRNKAIAFSIGENIPEFLKPLVFIVLPLVVLGILVFCSIATDELTKLQRWAIAGIIGGGIGNLIDRIFKPDGVVDFISVKFFGLFGLERWPTFNVADSAVVVCIMIWLLSMIFPMKSQKAEHEI